MASLIFFSLPTELQFTSDELQEVSHISFIFNFDTILSFFEDITFLIKILVPLNCNIGTDSIT